MIRGSLRPYYLMGTLIAAFLAVTASAGLLLDSLYAPFFAEALLPGLPVQDGMSLIAAPLLLAAMYYTGRDSARAFVVWVGVLVYVAYYYSFYVFGFAYTAIYPLYLALVGLATYSLIGLLTGADIEAFACQVGERMPVRFIGVVLGMALLFVPIWLMMIVQAINRQQAVGADLVFVFDLCFLIPAMTYAAVQVWRRRPLGYLLGGILLFKAVASGILLTLGTFRQMQLGYAIAFEQLAMYIFLAVAGSLALLFYMRNLSGQSGQKSCPHAHQSLRQQGCFE
ncbi:MAG: hypothetical protein ACOX87_08970 [Chloroflexota bacterium]|jgi:hypothetical protein